METLASWIIAIVGIITLVWAVQSWQKNLHEKWMNNLRDAGADLLGAAELIYLYGLMIKSGPYDDKSADAESTARAEFMTKKRRLLLLLGHDKEEQKKFAEMAKELSDSAEQVAKATVNNATNQPIKKSDEGISDESNVAKQRYRDASNHFFEAVDKRVQQEWDSIKMPFPKSLLWSICKWCCTCNKKM